MLNQKLQLKLSQKLSHNRFNYETNSANYSRIRQKLNEIEENPH